MFARNIGVLLLSIGMSACSSDIQVAQRDPEIVMIREPTLQPRPVPISNMEAEQINPLLSDLLQFSLLSTASYEDNRVSLEGICAHPSKYASRWQNDPEFSQTVFAPKRYEDNGIEIKGLAYSVWVDTTLQKNKRVALVFRGTDFEQFGDWYSSARWLTRLNPFSWDQYQQTRNLVPDLVEKLMEKYGKDVEIVATGHSLGGGLAQHAAYSSKDIDTVYAFAPSPVTGSSSLDSRVDPTGVNTLRVYESGEFLSGIRSIGRRIFPLKPANPKVTEARFNFRRSLARLSRGETLLSQHKSEQLTCDLICIVENNLSVTECIK